MNGLNLCYAVQDSRSLPDQGYSAAVGSDLASIRFGSLPISTEDDNHFVSSDADDDHSALQHCQKLGVQNLENHSQMPVHLEEASMDHHHHCWLHKDSMALNNNCLDGDDAECWLR